MGAKHVSPLLCELCAKSLCPLWLKDLST